jgi:hypothetical protein
VQLRLHKRKGGELTNGAARRNLVASARQEIASAREKSASFEFEMCSRHKVVRFTKKNDCAAVELRRSQC